MSWYPESAQDCFLAQEIGCLAAAFSSFCLSPQLLSIRTPVIWLSAASSAFSAARTASENMPTLDSAIAATSNLLIGLLSRAGVVSPFTARAAKWRGTEGSAADHNAALAGKKRLIFAGLPTHRPVSMATKNFLLFQPPC